MTWKGFFFVVVVVLRKNNIICGGFPHGTAVKNPRAVQEIGFNPWVRMIPPREENGNAFKYSCLGNPMDRGAWWEGGAG